MPTKTERILSYLPLTFQKRPPGNTLRAVIEPFGDELQKAENSLAAVMQAHWVDYADLGAEQIIDLKEIAALYGLAPRDDELVEEFREHLKRYVRTFLDGTVTVQGLLRITAESLGLHIADGYDELDTWWQREDDAIIVSAADGRDAAAQVLGLRAANERGLSAKAAHIVGTADLRSGVDCSQAHILRLEIDGVGPFNIDLQAEAADKTAVSGQEIADAINITFDNQAVASFDGRFLTITSPLRNAHSVVEVQDVTDDAADLVLGLAPRAYYGRAARAATIRGTVDLSGVLDLSEGRYLRLLLDGTHLAEIDCAPSNASHTLLDAVVEAMNTALGLTEDAVTHDGQFLTLTSPSSGLGSSIVFQRAAAQQALLRLFGPISNTHVGRGPLQARVVGRRDLSAGVDLSQASHILLRIDGGSEITLDCAGEEPANTQLPELVALINEGLGSQIASHNGRFLILTSTTNGPSSEILFLTPVEEDAAELIFGIGPRIFHGRAATPARLIGTTDLSAGADLRSRYLLNLAVDGRAPITIDLRPEGVDLQAVQLRDMADLIDTAVGADVAATDGQHLILVSPTLGSGSSLTIEPLAATRHERFISRALITDEATPAVFGFNAYAARGEDAINARVIGQKDLQRGVDLQNNRYLRLAIDGYDGVDIDCAGPRPRATLLTEARDAINAQLRAVGAVDYDVAADNGRRLILSSKTAGKASRIAFEAPRMQDAIDLLLGVELGEYVGQDAESVNFIGTADLSAGVDLSSGDMVKIGLDGADPVEIACATNALDVGNVKLNEIVININQALGGLRATHNGKFIQINTVASGAASQLVFAEPAAGDATQVIFGIDAPRSYHGMDAQAAQVMGTLDLSQPLDMRVIRFLSIGVDGAAPAAVDCVPTGAADATAVSLEQIMAAIGTAVDLDVSKQDDKFLVLSSQTTGANSKIALAPHTAGEARESLFGDVATETSGEDAQPATIIGSVDLLNPVDLSTRSQIRLAVDGGLPVDIDLVGISPAMTFADEISDAINAVFPDLASVTAASFLQLTAPTTGRSSTLEILPLRTLDLIEYPPQAAQRIVDSVRHGTVWSHDNTGAAATYAAVKIHTTQGVAGPALVNTTVGWQLRLLAALGVDETAHIWAENGRLHAEIQTPQGNGRPIHPSQMIVGPLGTQAWVPTDGKWPLSGDGQEPTSLQLNNPRANHIVQLHAREAVATEAPIEVMVSEAQIATVAVDAVRDDGQVVEVNGRIQTTTDQDETQYLLTDADDNLVAHLRAGAGIDLAEYAARVVKMSGTIHPDENEALLIVQTVAALFDVHISHAPADGEAVEETYTAVTIGHDPAAADALARAIHTRPSQLVRAESLAKSSVLTLPQGRSSWRYMDCYGPRFDQAEFDAVNFPGAVCLDRGIFDVSRFATDSPEPIKPVFTSSAMLNDPPVTITFDSLHYQPGALQINLPADLPERFGARFDQARFGQGKAETAVELFEKSVTEPASDDFFIEKLLNTHSDLVEAKVVTAVPLNFAPIPMPFREPRYLSGGTFRKKAKIYLSEAGFDGFLEIEAFEAGEWGNHIGIAARASGPAMFDVAVIYQGVPFENGRDIVAGKPLQKLTAVTLEPGPVGILQAKAAGIHATVTRARVPKIK